MQKVKEYFLIYVASFENAAVMIIIALSFYFPKPFLFFSAFIKVDDFSIFHLVFLSPLILVTLTYKHCEKIQNPDRAELKTALMEWPDYWKLKARTECALVYSVSGILGWVIGLFLIFFNYSLAGSVIAICGIVMALLSLMTSAKAYLDVKDILY